jgi:4-hydroxy-tetrahydrodipicolinate synthase
MESIQEIDMTLSGIYPIVPTPFDEVGRIDGESIHKLAAFMAERRVQGLAILGVMGEAQKLNDREREEVTRLFRAAMPAGQALVVGVSAAGTDPAADAARVAVSLGADALLVGPPPVQNDEVIFAYYQRVAEAAGVPIVLHDYPASTGILLSPALIARLYKIDRVRKLAGEGLGVFGALGGMYVFEELDRGAIGIMTGLAYPEFLVEILERYRGGDIDGAATLFYDILPLVRFEFQPGLGVSLRKHIMVRRGVFRTPVVRHPGAQADPKTLEHLDRILASLARRGYQV